MVVLIDPDDLTLLSEFELADVLGRDRRWVARQVAAGTLPVSVVDDTGRCWFSRATLSAFLRRSGEVFAEQQQGLPGTIQRTQAS